MPVTQLEDQTNLLAFLEVIETRVSTHLRAWPECHRADVAQQAALKLVTLFRNTERLASIDNVAAYVERLVANVIVDAIREHAAERQMMLLSHEVAVEHADAQADHSDPAEIVANAEPEPAAGLTLKLTRKQRRLFDLYKQNGTKGIADALGVSRQTACERASRMLRAIREQVSADAA